MNTTLGKSKITLILLAYHHSADNIAAQRFRGLLAYLPRNSFAVRVLTAPKTTSKSQRESETIFIEGPLLAQASVRGRLKVGLMMATSLRKLFDTDVKDTWIHNAMICGNSLVEKERAQGNRVVVMATYSPIDALIAARLISDRMTVPLVQDFRDGLAFENLGRSGRLYKVLRRLLEKWVVNPASRIVTVSRPLESHFRNVYPNKTVELLYNGYEFCKMINRTRGAEGNKSDRCRLGHFGRISASDASRFRTFVEFVKFMSREKYKVRAHLVLQFYGELAEKERDLLSTSSVSSRLYGIIPNSEVAAKIKTMDGLLLITGNKPSTATGKIFEYLASGKRIVLTTLCQNEAAAILQEIGDDDIVLDMSQPSTLPSLEEFLRRLQLPFVRSFDKITKFDKAMQVKQLAGLLESAATGHVVACKGPNSATEGRYSP